MTGATGDDGITLMAILNRSAAWLAGKGVTNARRECEWLFCHRLGLSRLDLYTHFDMPVAAAALVGLRDDLRRRGRREPLAYILGTQTFCGLELVVDQRVLVPRPETEELVAMALADIADLSRPRVLDVGTGSGAIALAIKAARSDAQVLATDRSAAALAVARDNAARLGLVVDFRETDLLYGIDPDWDLVVANLPYVGEGERGLCDPEIAWEPSEALFAGPAGMDLIERLLDGVPQVWSPRGVAWIEFGFEQGEAVRTACVRRDFACTCHRDGQGHERMARITRGPA
jgi:release factor glutamine methyltransferase